MADVETHLPLAPSGPTAAAADSSGARSQLPTSLLLCRRLSQPLQGSVEEIGD